MAEWLSRTLIRIMFLYSPSQLILNVLYILSITKLEFCEVFIIDAKMRQVFMRKYFVGILLLGVYLTEITAGLSCREKKEIIDLIESELHKKDKQNEIINDVVNNIDVGGLFEDLTGIT